jgi:hypothetical protein
MSKAVHTWFKTGIVAQGPFTSSIYYGASCLLTETVKASD